MAVAVLLYGSETRVLGTEISNMIEPSEMRFLLSVKGCIQRDRLYSEYIHKELITFNIQDRIAGNKKRYIVHLNMMPNGRLDKKVWQNKSRRQQSVSDNKV